MARIFSENFEDGILGSLITTTNTGFTATSPGVGTGSIASLPAALTFGGSLCGSWTGTTGAFGSNSFTALNALYWRGYVYLPAAPVGGSIELVSARNGAATQCRIHYNTSGTVEIRNGTTTVWTSSGALPTSAWYRVEYRVDVTAGQQQIRFFTGGNLHGTTATTDSGNQTYSGLSIDNVRVGLLNPLVTSAYTFYVDIIAEDDSTWVGPATADPVTANAGADKTDIEPRSTVALTGSSTGTVTSRLWTQTGGSAVTLSNASTSAATFVAPATLTGTTLTFTYTVNGSTSDTMTVAVLPVTERHVVGGVEVAMWIRSTSEPDES